MCFKNSFLLIISLMFLFVVACNSGNETVESTTDTVMATMEPSTVVESDTKEEINEVEDQNVKPHYPLVVTDMLGREVELKEEPKQIIGISPTAMEMLYAIGGQAVGRDNGSKWNSSVEALPSVGGAYNPNIEAIVELGPSLIIIEALTQGHMVDRLASIGVPILAVRAASVKDVKNGLVLLGKAINKGDRAKESAEDMDYRIETAVSGVNESRSLFVLISDADRNLYAALPNSYAGAILDAMNLSNVASEFSESGPYPGYSLFSSEQAIASNPDVILTISPAPEPAPKLSTMLPRIPGYSELKAVTNSRVSEVSVDLFLQVPGPRIVDAIEELSTIIGEMKFE